MTYNYCYYVIYYKQFVKYCFIVFVCYKIIKIQSNKVTQIIHQFGRLCFKNIEITSEEIV